MGETELRKAGSEAECGFCHYETHCSNYPVDYGKYQFSERWLCEVCAGTPLSRQMLYPTGSEYEGLSVLGPAIGWIANRILDEIRATGDAAREETK